MSRHELSAYTGALLLVLAVTMDEPSARARIWRALSNSCSSAAWHLWRAGMRAHDRYATLMMDTARKGT